MDESTDHKSNDKNSHRWEIYFGLALSIFAAVLAVNDLGAGKFGDDELQLGNEKTKSYMWYQSKSIKESLAKGQLELLNTLIATDSISPEKLDDMKGLAYRVNTEIQRYKREKDEILRGSNAVGEAMWSQEIDGQLGQVIGAHQIEAHQDVLARAGDKFDMGSLFLQISLVLGAIGLIVKRNSLRFYFLAGLVTLGLVGSAFCIFGYRLASIAAI